MPTARSALLLLCLALCAAGIRGQEDFDLAGALDDDPTTPPPKKPVPTKKPSSGGDDFDLAGALDDDGPPQPTPAKPKPNPGGGGGGGTLNDDDLFNAAGFDPKKPGSRAAQPEGDEHANTNDNTEEFPVATLLVQQLTHLMDLLMEFLECEAQPTSVVAGIASAVGVALIGAVSSFIAYQKKKLCFKNAGGDSENVNMDQRAGIKAEPQAQHSLLSK